LSPSIRICASICFSEDGKLRSFVNVYLNDEDIRYLSKDATPVKETDIITIVPSVAGGIVGCIGATSKEFNKLRIRRDQWQH
jgi:hypothetical protein